MGVSAIQRGRLRFVACLTIAACLRWRKTSLGSLIVLDAELAVLVTCAAIECERGDSKLSVRSLNYSRWNVGQTYGHEGSFSLFRETYTIVVLLPRAAKRQNYVTYFDGASPALCVFWKRAFCPLFTTGKTYSAVHRDLVPRPIYVYVMRNGRIRIERRLGVSAACHSI